MRMVVTPATRTTTRATMTQPSRPIVEPSDRLSIPSSLSGLRGTGLIIRADGPHDLPVGIRPPLPEVPAVPPGLPNLLQVDRGGDVALLRFRAGGEDLG